MCNNFNFDQSFVFLFHTINYMEKYTPIKYWSESDRPREKLINKGISALSDSELIAILIGSGNKNKSAVELSREILNQYNNNLNSLGKAEYNNLMNFAGMGPAKAISIVAALELGRRRNLQDAEKTISLSSSSAVFDYLQPIMGDLITEEFRVVYLNRANKIIENVSISKGGTTGTVIDIKIIMKRALEILAQGIIIAHNHPSGNKMPSKMDINITEKIKNAAELFSISVLDHIIVADKTYYSFRDEGLL